MKGLDISSECEQLLRDIAELRGQLETIDDEEERKKINRTLNAKQSRYDQLQCGAIDPTRNNETNKILKDNTQFKK